MTDSPDPPETLAPVKRKGRPPRSELVKNTPGKMAKRGRPPGEAAAMAEFKARILTSPKSVKVIESILSAALDDDHKNQAAAWKILMDRMVPLTAFEKGANNKPAVTINITGIGSSASVDADVGEVIDGDYDTEEEDS
jgi:predicted lipid-binding transport protein (Tim44 family)